MNDSCRALEIEPDKLDDERPLFIQFAMYEIDRGGKLEVLDAIPYCSGWLKWDGCTDFDYSQGPPYTMHRCGIQDLEQDFAAWRELYRVAAEIIEGFEA